MLFSIDKNLTRSHMLGSQLGNFLILILFKQLLFDKIFVLRIDHNFLFGSFEIN